MRGDRFAAAYRIDTLVRLSFDADALDGYLERIGRRMSSRYGAIFGRSRITTTSRFTTLNPAEWTMATQRRSRSTLEAPFHC